MDERQKRLIDSNVGSLADAMNFQEMAELLQLSKLVEHAKVEEIVSKVESRYCRNIKLLNALQESNNPRAFDEFIQILEFTNNREALKLMEAPSSSGASMRQNNTFASSRSMFSKMAHKFANSRASKSQLPLGMNSGLANMSGSELRFPAASSSPSTSFTTTHSGNSFRLDGDSVMSPLKERHQATHVARGAVMQPQSASYMIGQGLSLELRAGRTCNDGGDERAAGSSTGGAGGQSSAPGRSSMRNQNICSTPQRPLELSREDCAQTPIVGGARLAEARAGAGAACADMCCHQAPARLNTLSISEEREPPAAAGAHGCRQAESPTSPGSPPGPLVCCHSSGGGGAAAAASSASARHSTTASLLGEAHRVAATSGHICHPSMSASTSSCCSSSESGGLGDLDAASVESLLHQLDPGYILNSNITMAIAKEAANLMAVQTATTCRNNLDKVYKMTARPRGFCLIVNNVDFEAEMFPTRKGSDEDARRFDDIFKQLGFCVVMRRNQSADQMRALFSEIAAGCKPEHDAVFVFILSHGCEHGIYGVDGIEVCLDTQLIARFDNENCHAMRGKPKVFVIQACRGKSKDFGGDVDALDSIACSPALAAKPPAARANQAPSTDQRVPASWLARQPTQDGKLPLRTDMMLIFPCLAGFVSVRNELAGSWLGVALAYFIMKHAHEFDFDEILRLVAQDVTQRVSSHGHFQSIETQHISWRKSLYFNPGIYI